jgi:hypothetical protein
MTTTTTNLIVGAILYFDLSSPLLCLVLGSDGVDKVAERNQTQAMALRTHVLVHEISSANTVAIGVCVGCMCKASGLECHRNQPLNLNDIIVSMLLMGIIEK